MLPEIDFSFRLYPKFISHNFLHSIAYYISLRPGSSVAIATVYELDGSGSNRSEGREFPQMSRPALGPTQPPVQSVSCHSPGGKDADHSIGTVSFPRGFPLPLGVLFTPGGKDADHSIGTVSIHRGFSLPPGVLFTPGGKAADHSIGTVSFPRGFSLPPGVLFTPGGKDADHSIGTVSFPRG